jgi:glucokinase
MQTKEVAAGIDIGGTNTTIGAVTRSGTIIWRSTFPTKAAPDFPSYLEELNHHLDELRQQSGVQLVGIGIGAPAGNHLNGTMQASNVSWGRHVPLVEALLPYYDMPVALDNDANVTAVGEMHFGAAQLFRNFIMITLGTGLGSGIVANGEVMYGHDGLAGELGHIVVDLNGRECLCGRKGCLETYVSATGLKRTVFELLANRTDASPLRNYSFHSLNARQISEAAGAGDSIALEAFELAGKLLGWKLADAIAHTSPEAIILFGGLANAGPLLLEPTSRSLKKQLLFLYDPDIPLLLSALPESDAALLGAAALVWQKIEKTSKRLIY